MEYALRVLDTFSTIQGNLKKGLTVYNPLAHPRNFIGAASYTVGSGNIDGIAAFAKLSKIEKQEVMDDFSALGFKGSQVEINQMFNRINDLGKNTTDYGKLGKESSLKLLEVQKNFMLEQMIFLRLGLI